MHVFMNVKIIVVVGRLGTGKMKEIYFDCLGRHDIVTFFKARRPYLRSIEPPIKWETEPFPPV
jgi:hypothetical protein